MKKGILILVILCLSLCANAQGDSVLVVIDCDSLYRPFLDSLGSLNVSVGSEDYNYKISKARVFKIPMPKDSTYNYLSLRFGHSLDILTGAFYAFNKNGYRVAKFDHRTGLPIETKIIKYNDEGIIKISIPIDISTDKYLIDNTCSKCNRNDKVSWIQYGMPMESPITGEIEFFITDFYNPYNNPLVLPHYLGGCSPMKYHWYCNRCDKMY